MNCSSPCHRMISDGGGASASTCDPDICCGVASTAMPAMARGVSTVAPATVAAHTSSCMLLPKPASPTCTTGSPTTMSLSSTSSLVLSSLCKDLSSCIAAASAIAREGKLAAEHAAAPSTSSPVCTSSVVLSPCDSATSATTCCTEGAFSVATLSGAAPTARASRGRLVRFVKAVASASSADTPSCGKPSRSSTDIPSCVGVCAGVAGAG
mmetsp:Transcript_15658/g.24941  ORF Transcript_15658/g.24941 Transcript_15658/m.24941 type:complete len:210 (+) Transcript_15658:568-1197(+)